jgi:hypothetical protein
MECSFPNLRVAKLFHCHTAAFIVDSFYFTNEIVPDNYRLTMFFFNGRIRSAHVAPVITREQPYTHKIGNSCIITTCLMLIIGMTLIVTGTISRTEKTTLIGIGIISIGIALSITTVACFNTQIRICYRNWAYGPPTVPVHLKKSQRVKVADMTVTNVADTPTIGNEATCNSVMTVNI